MDLDARLIINTFVTSAWYAKIWPPPQPRSFLLSIFQPQFQKTQCSLSTVQAKLPQLFQHPRNTCLSSWYLSSVLLAVTSSLICLNISFFSIFYLNRKIKALASVSLPPLFIINDDMWLILYYEILSLSTLKFFSSQWRIKAITLCINFSVKYFFSFC